jgi:hypothetical protein
MMAGGGANIARTIALMPRWPYSSSVAAPMRRRPDEDEATRQQDADRQTKALAGLAVVLALGLVALFVIQHLKTEGEIEDCLLAQRTNCDALIER